MKNRVKVSIRFCFLSFYYKKDFRQNCNNSGHQKHTVVCYSLHQLHLNLVDSGLNGKHTLSPNYNLQVQLLGDSK